MKAKLLTLVLLVLACIGTARSQGPLLSNSVTGVNATTNPTTVNVTLAFGLLLKGTITPSSGSVPTSVTAASTTSSATFIGTVDLATNTYRIVLPADTYKLQVSFTNGGTSFTYTDSTSPTPFTVSADTVRNFTLPTVTSIAVSGNVSNLNLLFTTRSLSFDSTTIAGFSDVSAGASLDTSGNYAVNLPAGNFNVQLSQSALSIVPPASFSTSALSSSIGSKTVASTLNLTAPTITTDTLSGTVTITGTASIPANAILSVADTTAGPPQTTSSGSESLPSNGAYSLTLGNGDTYSLQLFAQVQILPSPAPLAIFLPPAIPLPAALTTNTIFNPNFPALPGAATAVTIKGRVTIAGTIAPVADASVTASGNQITGAANTEFSASANTDAQGNYSIMVPAGMNYTVFVTGQFATSGDFDGDAKADPAVFRPSDGTWYVDESDPNVVAQQWGTVGDIPVRGDFDGDGKTDFAVWRPSTGTWFVIPSSTPGSPIAQQWGTSGDIPVPGDYDGDGKTDYAVWRPSTGTWFVILSSTPGSPIAQQWGTSGDIPAPGDYDGDGKTDYAVWRPSTGTWFIIPSSNPGTPIVQQWGTNGDTPVPGDYDGDGKTDYAIWRPSTGTWFVIPSSNPGTPIVQQWGTNNDIPVPADYDRDRKTDIAVWRPSTGTWYAIPSSAPETSIVTQWGTSGDVPTLKPIGQ
jgi:hypothetical protein